MNWIELIPTAAYLFSIIGYGSQLIRVIKGTHCRSVSLFKYALSTLTYSMMLFIFGIWGIIFHLL